MSRRNDCRNRKSDTKISIMHEMRSMHTNLPTPKLHQLTSDLVNTNVLCEWFEWECVGLRNEIINLVSNCEERNNAVWNMAEISMELIFKYKSIKSHFRECPPCLESKNSKTVKYNAQLWLGISGQRTQ